MIKRILDILKKIIPINRGISQSFVLKGTISNTDLLEICRLNQKIFANPEKKTENYNLEIVGQFA